MIKQANFDSTAQPCSTLCNNFLHMLLLVSHKSYFCTLQRVISK